MDFSIGGEIYVELRDRDVSREIFNMVYSSDFLDMNDCESAATVLEF
jgi:hypothetical protein